MVVARAQAGSVSRTIQDLCEELAAANPDDLVADGPGFRCSRLELQRKVEALASGLRGAGLRQGDRLAIWMPNSVEWIALLLAASRLGLTLVALNMRYKTEEVGYILKHSGAAMLVMAPRVGKTDYLAMLRSLVPEIDRPGTLASASLSRLRHVVLASSDPSLPHLQTLGDLETHADEAPPRKSPQANDSLLVLYTSGTTSAPKGVMVRESSLLANAQYLNAWMQLRADDRILLLSPFCGIYGVNALIGALVGGATCVISDTTDAEATIDLVEREKVTALGGTLDAILRPWTELQLRRPRDLSLLRSRIVPVAWMQGDPTAEMPAVEAALGIRLVHTYGLSEGTAMSLLGDPQETQEQRHSGRLRPISPEVEVKVMPAADAADRVEAGIGELCLRGPLIMAGYLDDPVATRAAIDEEGWLHTGDFARMYRDGAVRYEGRIKDMVKISGYSVSPAEIEHFLSSHPAISDIQVVGVPGGEGSDMIAAFVIPKQGAQVDRDSIAAFCEGRIATFKIPAIVRSVSEFPIAPSANADKVQKKFLRDLLVGELEGKPSPENIGRKP